MDKAAFLGPKGENADEFERLLLEVLHDHVFWRRNFHPSDPRLISEHDKATPEYREMVARLRDELFEILAELKRGAPLYSPRQAAHMVSDPTMPALVGYFTGMLYNQNNVVAEVSPETVRKERAYLAALARMIGYPEMLPERLTGGDDEAYSWGHLASGGTGANLEALWVVRNLRFYPLALRLLAAEVPRCQPLLDLAVALPDGRVRAMGTLTTYQLFNVATDAVLDLHDRAERSGEAAPGSDLPSVRRLGLARFMQCYNEAFAGDPCRLPRVLVSQAAHYGWHKSVDVVGLGRDALVPLPVDRRLRLDLEALRVYLAEAREREEPVLAVVSIAGTTEEGAVDPLDGIEALRRETAADGLTFWHHCDAAMGGFYASMLPRDERGRARPYEALAPDERPPVTADVYRAITALGRADSVTIDPHKFGYVPYPCGAVLFRRHEVRRAISFHAPYLADEAEEGFGSFLGRWTLEGSRPGAAAVSAYLSQAVVPLDATGHGRLVGHCIEATKALAEALPSSFEAADGLRLVPLAEPDTTGFCFFVAPEEGADLGTLNRLNYGIWRRMTVEVEGESQMRYTAFLLSKTEMALQSYRHVLAPLLADAGVDEPPTDGNVVLLRVCVMNPLVKAWDEHPPGFQRAFRTHLRRIAVETASGLAKEPLPDSPKVWT